MKVYIVTRVESMYDSQDVIVGVFSSEESAQAFIKSQQDLKEKMIVIRNQIEKEMISWDKSHPRPEGNMSLAERHKFTRKMTQEEKKNFILNSPLNVWFNQRGKELNRLINLFGGDLSDENKSEIMVFNERVDFVVDEHDVIQ